MPWEYLDRPELAVRQVIAAHFLRGYKHIVEIGGYKNPVTFHLFDSPEDVIVVDPLIEPLELHELNGRPCFVRHLAVGLSEFDFSSIVEQPFALVVCGMDLYCVDQTAVQRLDSICNFLFLLSRASLAVVEYAQNLPSAERIFGVILSILQPRIAGDFRIDLTRFQESGAVSDETRNRFLRRLTILKDPEKIGDPQEVAEPVARILFGSEAAKVMLSKSTAAFVEMPGGLLLESAQKAYENADISLQEDGLHITTAPEAWSYAAIVKFEESITKQFSVDVQQPATVEAQLVVEAGELSVGVVDADDRQIAGERLLKAAPGQLQKVEIFVPDIRRHMGFLCRNGELHGTVSKGRIVQLKLFLPESWKMQPAGLNVGSSADCQCPE